MLHRRLKTHPILPQPQFRNLITRVIAFRRWLAWSTGRHISSSLDARLRRRLLFLTVAFQPNRLGPWVEDDRSKNPKKRCSELGRRDGHRADAAASIRGL